jgi:hypothetical protein
MKGKPSKTNVPPVPRNTGDDVGMALHGLAKELGAVAEELHPLCHVESMSDHIGSLAAAVSDLARATAMSVIAKRGTDEDRAVAIEYLKGWFDEFRK